MGKWLKAQWEQIRGNFKYDLLKNVAGAAMISFGGYLIHRIGSLPDWLPFLVVFFVALVAFFWLTLRHSKPSAPIKTASRADPLRDKVKQLGWDLFAFLREKGPDPNPGVDSSKSTLENIQYVMDVRGPWVEAIHYGYQHRFKPRVADLVNELGEHGLSLPEIEAWEIDPQVQNAERVTKIAEALFMLSARMEIANASKGT